MTIGKTIRQLLEERKKVILPGFGNLEVKESGGAIPTTGKRIDPPGLSVRFDGSFSKDDGLLASALAEEEQVDPAEAGQQVLELVDAIKFALDKGEPYTLAGTGIFSRDDDGKVHFKTDPDWVLEPDQFGLDSMELLELDDLPVEEGVAEDAKEPEQTGQVEEKKSEPAKTAPVEAKETAPARTAPVEARKTAPVKTAPVKPAAPVHEPWKKDKKPKRRFSGWRVIWIIAGSLIVILVALILIPADRLNLFDRGSEDQQIPVEETVTGTETTDPSETDETRPAEEGTPAEVAEPVQDETVEEAIVADNFFIIAGSFKHLGNASELQDQMKARGFTAEVMVTENRMYRVSIASFATRGEAESELVRLKSVPGLEACWLLSN